LKQNFVPVERIEVVNGVELVMIPLGQIIATFLVPKFLLSVGNWRAVYLIVAAFVFLVGVFWVLIGKKHLGKIELEESQKSSFGSDIVSVLRQPAIWLASFSLVGPTAIYNAFFTFWPQFAVDHIQLDLNTAGMILSLLPFASIVSSLSMPHISKATGIEKPFIWIWGFLLPIFYLMMLVSDRVPVLIAGSLLAGFGASAYVPFLVSYPYKIPGLSKTEVTIGVSIVSVSIMLASGLGPIIISYIFQGSNDLGMALKVGSFFPLTLAIGGLLLPKSKKGDQD
jgi:cyanate permease